MTPVDHMGVDAVLFDYGMTLVTAARPDAALLAAYTAIAETLRRHGAADVPDPPALLREIHDCVDARVADHAERGELEEIDLGALIAALYRGRGWALDDGAIDALIEIEQRAWWEGMRLGPSTLPTLSALRDRGIRIGLCSNAPYRPASLHGQLAHVGIAHLIDAAVFSSEVGWRKPSPQIFARAVEALGVAPQAAVMVGDRVRDDVLGARRAGLRAIRTREHCDDGSDEHPDDVPVIDSLDQLVTILRPLT